MGRSVTTYIVGFGFVLAAMPACATPITFTDEASFLAALGDPNLRIESFETSSGTSPISFPTVTVQCSAPGTCDSFGTSTLQPTLGNQGVEFSTPGTITLSWSIPVTAFGLDLRDLGTTGPTDLVLVINGNTIYVLTNHTGSPGGKVFIGVIDSDYIYSAQLFASNDKDGVYMDRLQTQPEVYGIFGGERAPDFDEVKEETDSQEPAVTPEPAATWLMLAGLGGLGLKRRLRRSQPRV